MSGGNCRGSEAAPEGIDADRGGAVLFIGVSELNRRGSVAIEQHGRVGRDHIALNLREVDALVGGVVLRSDVDFHAVGHYHVISGNEGGETGRVEVNGHGFHFFELQVREHIACVLAAPTIDTRFRSLLREVHRGRLCALFDVDCIFVVGRGAKFHGAKVRFVVLGELGLALVSAQVHGAAGGKRHEVRAVVAEDCAFVGAVGRGLQLPYAFGGAVCRDIARAVVRFDLEEHAFLGHIQFIEPVVGVS